MRKVVLGGLGLMALVAVAFMMTPGVSAQQQDRTPVLARCAVPGARRPRVFYRRHGQRPGWHRSADRKRAGRDARDARRSSEGRCRRRVRRRTSAERRQFTRLVRETAPGRAVKMTVLRGGSKRTLDITPEARDSVTLQQFPRVTGDAIPISASRFQLQLRRAGRFSVKAVHGIAASSGCDGGALERSARGLLRREGRRARLGSPREHTRCVRGRESRRCDHRRERTRRAVVDGLDAGSARGRAGIDHRASVTRDRKETTMKVTLPQRSQRRPPTAGTLPI